MIHTDFSGNFSCT